MVKSLRISPIEKTYPSNFKTFESSLAANGYNRFPGTHIPLVPKKLADGRYLTGVDKGAMYLQKMSSEEKAEELKTIDELLKKLQEVFGTQIDFANPRADVWNAYGDSEVKASPVKLGNGQTILNPDVDPQDLINYCWVRVDPRIARSLESAARGECPGCNYYVENSEAENRVLYMRKREINKAIVEFEELTPTKKKQVARLMGLPVSDDSTEEAIYNMIDTVLKKPEFDNKDFKNLNPVKYFNEIVKLSNERLFVKDLIEQAIRHNVYRMDSNKKLFEGERLVANSKDEWTDYLMDDINQKELLALGKAIKLKETASLR